VVFLVFPVSVTAGNLNSELKWAPALGRADLAVDDGANGVLLTILEAVGSGDGGKKHQDRGQNN